MTALRKLLSLVLTLAFLLTMAVSASAAVNVANFYELQQAIENADGSEVEINFYENIHGAEAMLTESNVKYTINSHNGKVLHNIGLYGDGDVTIHSDIHSVPNTGIDYDGANYLSALLAFGNVTVTVNGDIVAGYGDDGVTAYDSAVIIVNGDVHGGGGHYDQDSDSMYVAASGVNIHDRTKVTVNGNVYGGDGEPGSDFDASSDGADGADVDQGAMLTVNGNVYGGATFVDIDVVGSDGIEMDNSSLVIVNGNVYGGDSLLTEGGSGVKIEYDYDSSYPQGRLTVTGAVAAGSGMSPGYDLDFDNDELADQYYDGENCYGDLAHVTIKVGSYETVCYDEFTQEDQEAILKDITVTGLHSAAPQSTSKYYVNLVGSSKLTLPVSVQDGIILLPTLTQAQLDQLLEGIQDTLKIDVSSIPSATGIRIPSQNLSTMLEKAKVQVLTGAASIDVTEASTDPYTLVTF